MGSANKMTLEQMILKAIPVNSNCAIEEQYNILRRKLLKERIEGYIADQLSQQFNAHPLKNIDRSGLGESPNGSVGM